MAAAAEDAAAAEEEEKESGSSRMIALKSNDEKLVEVTEASARQSRAIANLIDDGCADVIPLPNVDSKTLAKVIPYCDEHGRANSGTDEERAALRRFDADFVGELDKDKASLIDVIMAANYLNIQGLLDITCQRVADTIGSATAEEIREAFDIEDDLTEAEKKEIREENAWAFDGIPCLLVGIWFDGGIPIQEIRLQICNISQWSVLDRSGNAFPAREFALGASLVLLAWIVVRIELRMGKKHRCDFI
uniref:SKP1-like protein n=1 Tax=Oryza glumipatula TaxID=40148 RepID=A0A0E0AMY5_9ORYZ